MADHLEETTEQPEHNNSPEQAPHDSLLSCLQIICGLFGKLETNESLVSGLPLKNSALTIDLFVRAASRIGIEVKTIKRKKIEDIPTLACPAVLILKNGQSCVLQDIDHEERKALVYHSDFPEDSRVEDFDVLNEEYEGVLLLIKEEYKPDRRTEHLRQSESKHWFWSALTVSLPLYKSMLFASLMINLLVLVTPLFVMNVYDRIVPNHAMETLWVLSIGVVLALLFDFFIKWLRFHATDVAGKKADIILSSRIMEHVLALETKEHPKSVGSFSKSMQDFESIRDFITSSSIATLIDIPFALLLLAVIYWIGGTLVFVPLAAIVLLLTYSFIVQPFLKSCIQKTFQSQNARNATLIESLLGLETVQLHGAQANMQAEWEQHTGFLARWGAKSKMLTHSTTMVTGLIQQLSTVGIIIVGVYLIIEGEMTMGALIACNMIAGRAMAPMAQLVGLLMRYFSAKTALDALNMVMQKNKIKSADKNYINIESMEGDIALESVNFSYPGQNRKSLDNVNLKIASGEKVGIIGRVGSGKSTLGKMMLGLYPADEGLVRLDNIDIQQIDPTCVRNNMGCVPQDTHIFFGSVRDNIVFGSKMYTDQEIIDAATKAGVNQFTELHSEGLDMPLLERGGNLSGGQRQAIVLARLFISNPKIVVMDEPTSMIDQKSEQQICANLKTFCQDKTLVLITHRMPVLNLVDRLIVIDQGKIVADGDKQEVIAALKHGKIIIS